MKQWQFNIIIVAAILAVISLALFLIPDTQVVGKYAWEAMKFIFNLIVFLLIWIVILVLPGMIAFYGRVGIDKANDAVVSDVSDLNPWLHVLICIALGFALSVVWMYLVRWLVLLPTWVQTVWTFVGDGDAITKLKETLPWGWAIYCFVVFVIGYAIGSRNALGSNYE